MRKNDNVMCWCLTTSVQCNGLRKLFTRLRGKIGNILYIGFTMLSVTMFAKCAMVMRQQTPCNEVFGRIREME